MKLVKQGKTHPLGIIIDSTTPAFPPEGPHLMRWTAPTRRHLGAKVVVSMNHREIGAAL